MYIGDPKIFNHTVTMLMRFKYKSDFPSEISRGATPYMSPLPEITL